MKRRIFIDIHYMEIGGAEISLIGMLQAIDFSKYTVDLFIHSHQGELMEIIPKEVNILPEIKSYAHIEKPMKEALMHGFWGVLYGRLKAKWLIYRYMHKKGIQDSEAGLQYVANCVSPFLPSLNKYGEYDLAISYLTPHNYVLEKVHAKKKICWIHTDYTRIDINVAIELPIWRKYDHIMSISPDVTKTFLQVFPSLDDKIIEMENILSPSFVRSRAEEFNAKKELNNETNDSLILLSIGRFSYPKNFDNIPDICRRLITHLSSDNSQLKIKWFIIGYGMDEQIIRNKIIENGMSENVIILGKKTNPYPYIKACDIYVQPSRYEGKSVTVREAQMLHKPVVVANYPTAMSQIHDGIDGKIVPLENKACARGIAEFITDTNLQEKIKNNLHNHDYGNEKEIEKIYQLIP